MFNDLKGRLNQSDAEVSAVFNLMEMADQGAPEDVILEDIAIPVEDEKKIEELLEKIPGDDFTSDEDITDSDLKNADNNTEDPTINDLLSDI